MRHGVAVERAQAGKLLPQVAGVLVQHAVLAVHHLVVGEGQDVVLAEGVEQAEGDLVVMVFAVDGIELDVGQDVVHPAHVPLEAEAQSAQVGGCGHHGEGGALLGDHHQAGEIVVYGLVEAAQEVDAVQILPPAEAVGDVLPRSLAEVVIDDAAHRVHADAIGMEDVQPEAGVAQKVAAHLAARIVKEHCAPLGDFAPAGIGMVVQVRAVEAEQTHLVAREVGGHPVQNHADAGLVAAVNEVHQLQRRAVARRGGVEARHLITPAHV